VNVDYSGNLFVEIYNMDVRLAVILQTSDISIFVYH
jgi:hypothetical protein